MDGVEDFKKKMGLVIVLLGLTGAFLAVVHSIFWPPKPIPLNLVDGAYSNACCSNLVIDDGRVNVEGRWISFSLDRDNMGMFALPNEGISIVKGRLARGLNRPYKLRFDDPDRPTSIEITDFEQSEDYVFVRR